MALAADSRNYKGSGEGGRVDGQNSHLWPGAPNYWDPQNIPVFKNKKFISREPSSGGRIICLRW